MHTLQATPSFFAIPKKALWLMTALVCGAVLSLTAATSYALDLVAFAGIAGPLTAAHPRTPVRGASSASATLLAA